MQSWLEGEKKRKLENTVKKSWFKHLGELHKEWTEDGVHQESPRSDIFRKRATKHFWNRNIVRSILPGLRRKRTGLLLSGPKFSFQMKVNFVFYMEIKVPESGGRVERHRIHVLEVQCEVSTVSDDLGCHVICWCWSIVFSEVHSQRSIYQDILEHFMLPSADKLYGDADLIFQQDLSPAHTAKGTKSWFNDHGVTVLDWPANSPDLNPIENIKGYCQERHQTQQCKWPEGRYQSNLGFHYTWAVPQADCLHATPQWCSNSCKGRPNQVLSA